MLKFVGLATGSLSFLVACANGGGGALTAASSSSSSAKLEAISSAALSAALSSDVTAGNVQILASNEVLPQGVSDIVVGVSLIELHVKNGSYVTLSSAALTLDLADLTSAVASIGQDTIAAGSYDKMRVTFSSLDVSYESGDSMSYTFSSSSTDNQFVSPLSPAIAITSTDVTHLLIDVGAVAKARGFGAGASMRPSPHSALLPPYQVIDLDTTGVIAGTISNDNAEVLADARVVALLNGQPVAAGRSDANGNYSLFGLAAGSYDVYVSKPGFALAKQTAITVTVGATSAEDVTITASSNSGQPPPSGDGDDHQGCPPPPWVGGANFDHP